VTIVLHGYQQEAVASVHPLAPGCRKLIVVPTGGGKSFIAAALANEGALLGRVLIITHVQELVEQNEADMRRLAPEADIGVYCSSLGRKEICTITVCAVQSIYKKLHLFEDVELVLIDEAHRISPAGGKMYRAVLKHFENTPVVGLTATPYRMGSGYLHEGDNKIFDEISYEVSYDFLVTEGFLAPFAERGSDLAYDVSTFKIERGEFKADDLGALVDYPKTEAIVEQAIARSAGRLFKLCFCINLRHCDIVAAILAKKGLTSVILHGKMTADERREARELFELGLVDVAINCNIWAIGYNFRRLDCIWLIRPIASVGFFIQVAGRLTRTADGKDDGLLLDYGGNVSRHGHFGKPEVRPPSKGGGGATKLCKAPECGEKNSEQARYCAVCKSQFVEMFKDCPKCATQVDRMTQVCPKCTYGWPINEQKLDEEGTTILPNKVLWLDVVDWNFRIHKKEGSPYKSLAIAYKTVDAGTIQEYIFPEHPHVQHRFAEWWLRHALNPNTQKLPKTAPDAYNNRNSLKRPERIKVIRSGKFYNFLGRSFA
jgi:DNA repair protein RadD